MASEAADGYAGRVSFHSAADHALVSGFDQYAASVVGVYAFYAACTLLPIGCFVVGVVRSVAVLVLCLGVVWIFVQSLHFQVRITPSAVQLSRSCVGRVYFRRSCPLSMARFGVFGTGDAGAEGDWPMQHYCEVALSENAIEGAPIGSPRMALRICQFCEQQRQVMQGLT